MKGLKEFLESDQKELCIDMQPVDNVEAAMKEHGWKMIWDELETNGWEHDFWIPFEKDGETITFGGSWYSGNYNLSKD